jgi:hypothetical protein
MQEVFKILRIDVRDTDKLHRLLQQFVLLVILPQEAAAVRSAVKHWGDVVKGRYTLLSMQQLALTALRGHNTMRPYWKDSASQQPVCQ